LVALGAPVVLFLLLEGGLRVAGYGFPTDFFLSREVNGQAAWVDNWRFGWRFFPPALARYPRPLAVPQRKPAETTRIFVLGESAALGVPAPEFGFSRILEVLLEARFPGRKFEVVNVSMVAINSHAILPMARECARREGDLWVIYMGNNEVIGPFGAHGVLGARVPPLPLVRANLALKRTRVGQLVEAGVRRLRSSPGGPTGWRGMQLWKEPIRREDRRIERVLEHFQVNLEGILEAGERAGTPIVLSTVACNLKDCSPFASAHRAGLTAAEQAEWDQAYQGGMKAEAAGKFEEALNQYQAAARVDDRFAELQFRRGTCSCAVGRTNEARQYFQQARDEDALQFRAETRLNEAIRAAAKAHAGRGVRLVDAEELVGRGSPSGVPGEESFYEHVHLTGAGNYTVARATAEAAAECLVARNRSGTATNGGGWLSQDECEQRLGLTDWSRLQTLELVQEMLQDPPFTSQSIHANQSEKLRRELKRLRHAADAGALAASVRRVEQAASRRPNDAELMRILGPMLEAAGDLGGAERQWRGVIERLPQAAIPYVNLGRVLSREARNEEAARAFGAALERNADTYEAHMELGVLWLRQGRAGEAIPHLRAWVRAQPDSVAGRWQLGRALADTGRREEAMGELREALRLDPTHAEAKGLVEGLGGR
jgi:tetratricopeptide (TPR) repeat protein